MTIKKIADVSAELRLVIEAALAADNAPAHAVIGEANGVAKGVVRMIDLKRKQALAEEAASEEAAAAAVEAATTTEDAPGATSGAAATDGGELTGKAAKLAALKAQVGENDVSGDAPKAKKTRTKREPVDTTTRDVIVASSVAAGVAWMSGNIGYKGKDDAWVTGDLLKTAKGRKGAAQDNLLALAEAGDLVIERNVGVLVEEHEAIMAGHWDRLEAAGRTMIGRRPKGFKKIAAPKTKKVKADEEESVEDLDAAIAALMAKKQKTATKPEATEQPEVEGNTTVEAPVETGATEADLDAAQIDAEENTEA